MGKIAFSKLNLKNVQNDLVVNCGDYIIEVKPYLPISKKMQIIEQIVQDSVAVNSNYYNPGIVEVRRVLGLVENYTNINFTEKQKNELDKTYDILIASNLADQILKTIPQDELAAFDELLMASLDNIYHFNNSLVGILNMANDANNAIEELKKLLADSDLTLLKDIMTHLD